MTMNKYTEAIRKMGAILQTQKATEEEVKKAYNNSSIALDKDQGRETTNET